MSLHHDLLPVAVPPPFALLGYGESICPGDIKQLPGSPLWEDIRGCEIGMKTPKVGITYARLIIPSQTRLAYFGERITVNDLCWVDGVTIGWVQASRLLSRHGYSISCSVDEFYAIFKPKLANFGRMFVVKPESDIADYLVIPRPSGSRELFPSDVLRPFDMVIGRGDRQWRHIAERLYGTRVRELGAEWTQARFIRPTSPMASNWWVCEEEGEPGFLGGFQDPFPSLDDAVNKIEQAARLLNQAVIGVVWRKQDKIPLMVFDPKLTPDSTIIDGTVTTPGTPAPAWQQPPEAPRKRAKSEAKNRQNPKNTLSPPVARPEFTPQTGLQIDRDAVQNLPAGVRLLAGYEKLQDHDIVFKEAPFEMPAGIPPQYSWQPVRPEFTGREVRTIGLPCGRLTSQNPAKNKSIRDDSNDRSQTAAD